jgi:nucleotide-binding universal stress UspA family protein
MKVLIGYDGSTHADTAIDDLKWAGLPPTAEAIVLSAVEWPTTQAIRSWGMVETDFSPEWLERIKAADQLAETGADRLQRQFRQWNVQCESSAGNPAESILEKARSWPADLIVIGTHGRSALARVVLGSVSLKLIREATCSVRVARSSNRHEGPARILIGIDGSPNAEITLNEVCSRSWPAGTEARVLAVHEVLVAVNSERIAIGEHIYDKINEDEYFRMMKVAGDCAGKLQLAGLRASPLVEQGDPKKALVQQARDWNANTIFVGARGLGRIEGLLLGSVSSAAVAHAPCTVEVVRR